MSMAIRCVVLHFVTLQTFQEQMDYVQVQRVKSGENHAPTGAGDHPTASSSVLMGQVQFAWFMSRSICADN